MQTSIPRNVLFGFLSWLLPLVSTIIVTPFVIRGMGAEEFGLYTLVLGFIGYSFVFGTGRAATKYVAEYNQSGEIEKVENILSATLILSLLIGVGGALVLAVAAKVLVADLLLIKTDLQIKAVTAFYLAAATVALMMLQQVYSALLQAVNRFDWFSHITTLFSTLLSVGNLILVWRGGDALVLLWWNLILTVGGAMAFYWAARRALPSARFRLFRWRLENLRLVARYSAGVIGYQICGNILLLFERSWITRNLGAESLTYYTVPMQLAGYIHLFIGSFLLVLMPLASALSVERDNPLLLSLYLRASKIVCLLAVLAAVAAIIGSRAFLELWLGAEFAERSATVMILHVLTWGVMATCIVGWQLADGMGFPSRNAWLVFAFLIISAPLMILLLPSYGLVGAAAGRAAGVVLSVPIFIALMERVIFGKIQMNFWRQIIMTLILAGGAGGATEFVLLKILPLNWFSLILSVASSILIFLGVLLLLRYFTLEERIWLQKFAGRAFAAN
ncbi:MAG: oligosaccharide flippase family protein [Pyrinomonadaceae bacterium]